jgi:SAM-dependent methyltransferase
VRKVGDASAQSSLEVLAAQRPAGYSHAVVHVQSESSTPKTKDFVYNLPLLYDIAFSFRDYRAEASVITDWFRRISGRDRVRSVLELASGPCAHALELVREGAVATGIDISEAMCTYARGKAASLGLPLEVACQDMTEFRLDRRFDLAILMLNSVGHLYTLDAFVRHLRSVARHLEPRGVYVIEMAHPNNFLGRSARPLGIGVARPWTVKQNDLEVTMTWGTPDDPYDAIAQIFDARVEIRAFDGKTEQSFVERCAMRDWTKTELEAAVQLSGDFRIAEVHGDFAVDAPFDESPESWRMIVVLERLSHDR